MTTAAEVNLQQKFSAKERDEMFEAYADALGEGNRTKAHEVLMRMPLHPRWAKIVAEVLGKEYLQNNFNITYANETFGEDWLNEI